MFLLLAFTIFLAPGDARPSAEFTKDSLDTVKKNIAEKKAVLVDVRSQEEWDEGHLKDSIFLPVTSLRKHSFDEKRVAKTVPKKKILYTFCVVGMRAKQAATILERHGYAVRALKPGYEQLVEAGVEVEKGEAEPASTPKP